MKINDCLIGKSHPTFIVAEVAQAHDGSLGFAHSYIEAVAKTGADAVKFQTHLACCESTFDEKFRINFSKEDKSRYDYWKRMEFSKEQWVGLKKHADDLGLVFLSSSFSQEGFDFLLNLGVPALKLASGEVFNNDHLESYLSANLPIILSTGMSNWDEISYIIKTIQKHDLPLVLMQCTSEYPTSLDRVGLNIIDEMRERFSCNVGLSDHSGSIFPGLTTIARGVDVLEIHITFDKLMFGPDCSSSITINDLKLLVEFRNAVHQMNGSPVNKDAMAEELLETRRLFSKSICVINPLEKGTAIKKEMLTCKKPGTGIPTTRVNEVIGKTLTKSVTPNLLLRWGDLE